MDTSTPTTENGYISKEYLISDQRKFHVPCVHCGVYQPLYFKNLLWDSSMDPDVIRYNRTAYYACEHCGGVIRDHDKTTMVQKGVWCPEGYTVVKGKIHGNPPRTTHRGYWINCLYSPWLTFSDIAAEFMESKDSPDKLLNFVNSWLAEDWVEKIAEKSAESVRNTLVTDYRRGEIPDNVMVLVAGVDIQKDHAYVTVRGWGLNEESWLIDAGTVELPTEGTSFGWEKLDAALFKTPRQKKNGDVINISRVFIDSGFRTDEVYAWCRKRNEVCKPTKGQRVLSGMPIRVISLDKHPITGHAIPSHVGVALYHIDTNYYKTKLFRMMTAEAGNVVRFHLYSDITDEYISQLTSERKVLDRNKTTGAVEEKWEIKESGLQNHFLDCEVLCLAAADILRVQDLREKVPVLSAPANVNSSPQETLQARPRRRGGDSWVDNTDNWI